MLTMFANNRFSLPLSGFNFQICTSSNFQIYLVVCFKIYDAKLQAGNHESITEV